MATALEQVRDYTGKRVQVRLRHRRRGGSRPDRAERGRGPADLGQEGRAGVDDRVAAGGLSALADHGGAHLAEAALPADRLPGDQLLLGAQAEGGAEVAGRDRPRDPQDLRQARHPDPRAGDPGRRRRRLRVRQRLGRDHLPGQAGRARRRSSARSPRRSASIPSWCASTWARSCRRATTSSPR